MPWTNYHSHTNFSDGKGLPKEYIESAIELGMKQYGFSDHAPLPFDCDWDIHKDQYQTYLSTIQNLKSEYANKIEILLSMEIDYIPGVVGPSDFKNDLDYTVSSVHFGPAIRPNDADQTKSDSFWVVDGPNKEFQTGLNILYGGDIRKGVAAFYAHTQQLVLEDAPDILGHMDKIKIQNKHTHYFEESEKWYQDLVLECLDTIAQTDVIVEVNTRGWYKKYSEEFYPSDWILKELHKRNIPIVINSDCHHPREIVRGFEEAVEVLEEIGFKSVMRYENGVFVPKGLGELVTI